MIPVTQTKVVVRNSKDEIVVPGNCYAAVVASMMELPIEQVPNVETLFFLTGDNIHFWDVVMNTFIEDKGWELSNDWRFAVYHDENFGISEDSIYKKEEALEYCKDKLYLVSGKSLRGVHHICIFKNGQMVHDPHPTRDGIITFEQYQTLELLTK